jgi:hypothetical protein
LFFLFLEFTLSSDAQEYTFMTPKRSKLEQQMEADAVSPNADALARIKDLVRTRRDLSAEIGSLEERLKEKQRAVRELDHVTLPNLFTDIGIDHLGIPAEGNAPAVKAVLMDYYKAVIAADWSEERRLAAFARMNELGWGDIIRRVIHISFDPKDTNWSAVADSLSEMGVPFTVQMQVPWTTLTATIKAHYEAGRRLSAGDLDTIGAAVGQVVKLKEEK